MKLSLDKTFRILMIEAFIHRRFVIVTFILVMAAALALGWYWPKSYTASATIIVDEKNIIQPLMLGAAVPTDVVDRARLAREVLQSRRILNQAIDAAGMANKNTSPLDRESMIDDVKRAMTVTTVGTNLIRLDYKDHDPERAMVMTKKIVDFFIAENAGTKTKESTAAFQFIDAQVKEYQAKLQQAEDNIKKFRAGALRATGPANNRQTREQSLEARLEQTQMDLKEAENRRVSIEGQLASAGSGVDTSGERDLRARMQQMQTQLANLRLNYQDTYPDIVRLKGEIADAKKELDKQQKERRAKGGSTANMDEATATIVQQQMRQELAQTQTQIATLRARLSETQKLLNTETATDKRVINGTNVSELTRDYDVNQAILDDLLKRRENARVSMNLDRDRQGLSFRIYDEPVMPVAPTGPLFIHFALGGLFLALLMPFGLLYFKHQLDSRVRSGLVIRDNLQLPLLASIPHLPTPKEATAQTRSLQWVGILAFSIVFIVISIIVTGSKL